ncbi:MAG: hypothetical protein ACQERT_05225 [Thermodesulfobacteriota bacterium]
MNDLKSQSLALEEDIKDDVLKDGLDFVHKTRADLEKWSHQLTAGELSKDEFKWLLLAKKDLAEMETLKQKGLTLARIDRYKKAMSQSVLNAVFTTLG